MKVYVTDNGATYRVMLKKPVLGTPGVKEFDVPRSAAYLLLAAQSSTDALQDSLDTMYKREANATLAWEKDTMAAAEEKEVIGGLREPLDD